MAAAAARAVRWWRARVGRGRDDGFTLVEVLVVVSITGIIAGALAGLLIQGFQRIPEAEDRTAFAGDVARLTDAFSDDIANAADVESLGAHLMCDALPGAPPALQNVVELGRWIPRGAGTGPYWLALLAAHEPDPAYKRVAIVRDAEVMLVGYCVEGSSEPVVVADYDDPSFNVTIRLASRPGGEVREIRVGGDRRTTG